MNPEHWQQVKEVFEAALEHDSEQRAAFLDHACAKDETIRREVQARLASHDAAPNFMDTTALAGSAGGLSGAAAKLSAGQRFGRFEVVSLLGAGGMGEVYLAHDSRLNRKIALKLLPSYFTDDQERVRRFEREARAASALNHHNILTIHEIGRADGRHFIATEFVEGETLRGRMERAKQLQFVEALDVAAQIASALQAAHAAGVIHRDIKPENIMLRRDGFVKVLDFGLAKLIEKKELTPNTEAETKMLLQTTPGMVMGTPSYMSPEQARGLEVDARTDIFSLGVVLYEMLAGRAPFAGESVADVLVAILHDETPSLFVHRQDTPAELERIVTKTLRKNSDERYQTAKDLLIDLKSLQKRLEFEAELEHTSPAKEQTKPKTPTFKTGTQNSIAVLPFANLSADVENEYVGDGRAEKLLIADKPPLPQNQNLRPPWLPITLLCLLIAAAGFFAYRSFTPDTGKQIQSIAVLPFVNQSGNADVEYLSDGMTESLISSLSQLPNLNIKARNSVFRYKGKDTDAQTIGKELHVQAILNGRIVQRGNNLTLFIELVDAKTDNVLWKTDYNPSTTNLLSLQSEIARDVSNKLKIKLSGADEQKVAKNYTQNAEAYQIYLRASFLQSKVTPQDSQKAIEYFQQAIALDPDFALAYVGLADAYANFSDFKFVPPREYMPKAREYLLKALSLDDQLPEAHVSLGENLLAYDYDFAGAEREFKRAIELNPNYAPVHLAYGELLANLSRREESSAELRRGLDLDPISLPANNLYGHSLFLARRYDEAIAQFEKTLELNAIYFPPHNGLAFVYEMKGDYAASIAERVKINELVGTHQRAELIQKSFDEGGWQGFLRAVTNERQPIPFPSSVVVASYAELGEKDKAFALLNKLYEDRDSTLVALKVDPRLDSLRSDPRFQDLLRRIGLPQ